MRALYALAGLGDAVSDMQAQLPALQALGAQLYLDYEKARNSKIIGTPEARVALNERLEVLLRQIDANNAAISNLQARIILAQQEEAKTRQVILPPSGGATDTVPSPIGQPLQPPTSTVTPPVPGVTTTQAPAAPITAAQQAEADRAGAESFRRAMYLIAQPGYDYGIGSERRNQFFNEGRDTMSGLGASFDFIGALTTAAKQTAAGYKGSEVLARAGITLPRVPKPIATFVTKATEALQAQKRAMLNLTPATSPATGEPVASPASRGLTLGDAALYAGLGVGAYFLIKRLSK